MFVFNHNFGTGEGYVPAAFWPNGQGIVAVGANVHPDAFIGPDARVTPGVTVGPEVELTGATLLMDNAVVMGRVLVTGNVVMAGNAKAYGPTYSSEGTLTILDGTTLTGEAAIYGDLLDDLVVDVAVYEGPNAITRN